MKVFTAKVVDIREESRQGLQQRWQMMLDHTDFSALAPRGVLEATTRSGIVLQVPVLGVVMDGGEVWHQVEKPLAAGTTVTGRLDVAGCQQG